jgi:hypothetical protein
MNAHVLNMKIPVTQYYLNPSLQKDFVLGVEKYIQYIQYTSVKTSFASVVKNGRARYSNLWIICIFIARLNYAYRLDL